FIANHGLLSGLFVFLLAMLIAGEIRRGGRGIPPALVGSLVNRENAVVLDIRADSDFRAGHIPASIGIPLDQVQSRVGELERYKGRPVVVVCNMGNSTGPAVQALAKAGHETVYRLEGGITAWRGENLPVVRG
ncbi:MAG: rhodanese-like domain-containing protein, partial [Gammaproteobacteria bacterium]|nr:rhodanese-like domain-containing protein [Gammaproteobacteria bacterium]